MRLFTTNLMQTLTAILTMLFLLPMLTVWAGGATLEREKGTAGEMGIGVALILSDGVYASVKPLPTPPPADVAEETYWADATKGNTRSRYEMYLAKYPKGKHAAEANAKIESLKQVEKARLQGVERTKWNEAERTKTVEGYSGYLRTYPDGEYAKQARLRLSKLGATETPPSGGTTTSNTTARIDVVWIPAGTFNMGTDWWDGGRPVHRVTISQGFYMGKYEVTQAQWKDVMGTNPSRFLECGLNCPVEQVSWDDVQEFIRRLNARNPGHTYRLPTEAEWEYAARAGTTGDYYGNLDSIAWYSGNSNGSMHPVGQKQANAFGLYDMSGNVWELVQDWYGRYSAEASTDPTGPSTGSLRVYRGGTWSQPSDFQRSAYRNAIAPSIRSGLHGFRVVRN